MGSVVSINNIDIRHILTFPIINVRKIIVWFGHGKCVDATGLRSIGHGFIFLETCHFGTNLNFKKRKLVTNLKNRPRTQVVLRLENGTNVDPRITNEKS